MNYVYAIGELFAGAGGMALGAQEARMNGASFEHAWTNDIDKDACQTLQDNLSIKAENVICSKVEKLDLKALSAIDGLAFGFPCNDFSMVGDRNGISGEYGKLYQYSVKALKHFRPLFFVAENVSGLRSSGGNSDFDFILNSFREAGYSVYPALYRFEEYGVPQSRHRIIIVGFRRDLNIHFKHPEPTHRGNPVSARTALANIPDDAPNSEYTKHQSQVIARLGYIKPGENAFTATMPDYLRLQMKSGATISLIYRRIRPDAPSYTVTGSGGGGTHMYHWNEQRALTNRERARLQTFPDNFRFAGGKESVRKQIGMAVPPVGAEVVFRAIIDVLVRNSIRPNAK